MTQFINVQTRYIRSRILEEILEDPTEQVYSFKSFDGNGIAITAFNWAIVSTIIMLLVCMLHKRSQPNEMSDFNIGTDPSPEEEEEMRKKTIFKLYRSEHIQQKITSDQIRHDRDSSSSRTIDTCGESSEEFQSGGDNLSSDGEYSYDEEEDHGTIVISPFPRVGRKPALATSTESSDENDTKESNPSNDDKNEKTVSNLCAICLEEYHEGDTIVWSSNKNCKHAFHRDCLTNYLVKVKEQETYPCPICRQNFFFDNEDKTCKACEEV